MDHLSWEWLFWFPLILVVIALAGVAFGVPESPVRTPGISKGREWGWGGPATLTLLIAGVVLLVVFTLVELRVSEPLIDMRLMRIWGVWTTNLVGLVFGFVLFGVFLLIPTLLELPKATGYGFGKTVTSAGLSLLPTVAMMLVFAPISGLLDRRFGPKLPPILGAAAVAIGFVVPAISHATLSHVLALCLISGAGIGLALAAMSNAIIEAVPRTHTAEATSVNQIVRTIGGSIGTAVIAAVIAAKSTPKGLPLNAAFTDGFWVCVGVGVLGVLAAILLPSARRRHADALAVGVEDLPPEPEEG